MVDSLRVPLLSVFGMVAVFLSSCQGTDWGEQVQRAVQVPQPERTLSTVPREITSTQRPTPRPPAATNVPISRPPTPQRTPEVAEADPVDPSEVELDLTQRFTDLGDYPLAARAVQELDRLGVFVEISGPEFEPERSVRRGEFARWLIRANNAIHQQEPSHQIRLARSGERPIFLDVPEDHPDFDTIQALGLAGIAEGDNNQEFRSESLLSRAAMIQLKAPLDLPPGQIEGDRQDLEEDWGFTDREEIPEMAVAAIVADRTLGEHSSILRAFGPIRAFDPLKPVTRAEAALTLAQFGEETAAAVIEQGRISTPHPRPSPTSTPSPDPTPTSTPSPDPSPTPTPTSPPTAEPTRPPRSPTDPPEEPEDTRDSPSPESAPGRFVTPSEELPSSTSN